MPFSDHESGQRPALAVAAQQRSSKRGRALAADRPRCAQQTIGQTGGALAFAQIRAPCQRVDQRAGARHGYMGSSPDLHVVRGPCSRRRGRRGGPAQRRRRDRLQGRTADDRLRGEVVAGADMLLLSGPRNRGRGVWVMLGARKATRRRRLCLPMRLPRPRRSGVGKGPQPLPAVAAVVCAGRVYDDAYPRRRAPSVRATGWRLGGSCERTGSR